MAWLRIGAHVLVALLLGLMYYGMGDEASKTTSNVACIFFFIMFLFFSNSMPTILTCKYFVIFYENYHSIKYIYKLITSDTLKV